MIGYQGSRNDISDLRLISRPRIQEENKGTREDLPGASASKEKASRRRPSSSRSSRTVSPLTLTPACTATALCRSTCAGIGTGGGAAAPGGQGGYRW